MTTIEEAKQSLEQQRQIVREQQQRAEEAKQSLEQQRQTLPNIRTQQALRGQKFKEGLAGLQQRKSILGKEKQISSKQSTVEQYKQQLAQYEPQLTQYEQQIVQAEAQQKAQQEAAQYNFALRVYLGQTTGGSEFRDIPEDVKQAARKEAESKERSAYRAALSPFTSQGLKPIISGDLIVGFEDIKRGQSIPIENIPALSIADINRYKAAGIDISPSINIQPLDSLSQPNVISNVKFSNNLMSTETNYQPYPSYVQKNQVQQKGNILSQGLNLIRTGFETVGKVHIPTPGLSFGGFRITKPTTKATVSDISQEFQRGLTGLGDVASKKAEGVFNTLNIPLTTKESSTYQIFNQEPIYLPAGSKTLAGGIVSAAKSVPRVGLWFTPIGFASEVGTELFSKAPSLSQIELSRQKQEQINLIDIAQRQQSYSPEYRPATKEEINVQAGGDIETSLKQQRQTEFNLALGGVAAYGALRGGMELFKPIVKRAGGEIIKPIEGQKHIGTVLVKDVQIEGKTLQYGRVEVLRNAVVESKTNRIKDLFGFEPTVRIVSPPKLNIAVTYSTPEGKVLFGKLYKAGKGGVEGVSQNILGEGISSGGMSAEELAKFGSKPEFLLQRLAEADTGIPVSKKLAPAMFGENDIFAAGKAKILSPSRAKPFSKIATIIRMKEPITLPSGTTVYDIEAISKDITKPLARNTGKTPSVVGKYFKQVSKEEESGVNIISPANIKKTPLDKTFAVQVQKEANLVVLIPNVKPASKYIPLAKADIDIAKIAPVTIEPVTQQSIYSGTGQYERTQEYGAVTPNQPSSTKDILLLSQPTKAKQESAIILDIKLKQSPILDIIPKTKQESKVGIKERTAIAPLLGVANLLGQATKQQQKQTTKTIQINTSKIKPPKINPPKIKIPKIPIPVSSSKKQLINAAEDILGDFKVYARKLGKDINIGEFKSFEPARSKFISELKSTPSASGYILSKGKPLSLEQLNLGVGFARSKKDIFRVIQTKETRMGTRAETRLIQKSRRKGGFF
jgi:hypothetical protein